MGAGTPKKAVAYNRLGIENNHFISQPFICNRVMLKPIQLNRTVVIPNK
jgi:hypothetical protein